MSQNPTWPRASAVLTRLWQALAQQGGALILALIMLLLTGGFYWFGSQLGRLGQQQALQEAQLTHLREQMRAVAQLSGAAGKLVSSGSATPAISPAKASILAPQAQQAVARVFSCTVRVEQPRQGYHYYLVLYQGQHCWLGQEVLMPPGGATTAWDLQRQGAMPAEPFSLLLCEVDQTQHQTLTLWQNSGEALPSGPPGQLLASVQLN